MQQIFLKKEKGGGGGERQAADCSSTTSCSHLNKDIFLPCLEAAMIMGII